MGVSKTLAPVITIEKNPYGPCQFRLNKMKTGLPVFIPNHMIPIATRIQAPEKSRAIFIF